MRKFVAGTAVLVLALAAAVPASAEETRYSVANGCFELKAGAPAGPYRLKATTLGEYLLYTSDRKFLAASGGGATPADRPTRAAEWRAAREGGELRLTSRAGDSTVTLGGRASGCAAYPEIEINATGDPARGKTYEHVSGLIDGHMHLMAFEFLGGMARCGRPWHKYGVEYALVDCPDHEATNGCGAVLENVLYGDPARCHDPVGWPTFRDWPHPLSLTHEGAYYRWLERAWRGGLRVFVNLLVENKALCDIYPLRRNTCNEMESVRLQERRIRELQDYIDAQNGGPGEGWFRLVEDPFEARRVIAQGKLAVVQGIEISQLFDCNHWNGVPQCDTEAIDRQLEEVYRFGVRQMELVNKFDNALAGVAGDAGTTGVVVNSGNKKETNQYWDMRTCQVGQGDKEQPALPRDVLIGNGLAAFLPPGTAPIYPEPPHCNQRGLMDLGEYVVRRMMEKKMIIDPDHLSQAARDQVLALVEAEDYPGIMSSHSWSNEQDYPRILAMGGVVTPYAGSSTSFVDAWRNVREGRDSRYRFGIGYGADMNGFGSQGRPRGADVDNPVTYPFKSFDGKVTLDQQQSGERVYDINVDGVAHYGLYPDWVEDLRKLAGDEIIEEMGRGAESYLQMWERAEGIEPAWHCRPGGNRRPGGVRFTRRGLGKMRLGATVESLVRRDGQQPNLRGRAWHYCVRDAGGHARITPVFTRRGRVGLIASTSRTHRARGVATRMRANRIRGARRLPGKIRVVRARNGTTFVYGVRRGRVRYVAVASRAVARKPRRLRAFLREARLLRPIGPRREAALLPHVVGPHTPDNPPG